MVVSDRGIDQAVVVKEEMGCMEPMGSVGSLDEGRRWTNGLTFVEMGVEVVEGGSVVESGD